jgi:hypothetical protein
VKLKWFYPVAVLAPFAALGCTPHIAIEPIKVEPIYITMDVNLKVDHELDEFFSYQKDPTTQPATGAATQSAQPTQPTTAETL